MVFNAISLILLVSAAPLWAYRQILLARLDQRARGIFHRLLNRHESPLRFATRIFGVLLLLVGGIIALVYAIGFLENGGARFTSYSDVIRNRLYSGTEPVDRHIDALFYDQLLPIVVILFCLLFSASFTLLMTAIRDIGIIRRLRYRLDRLAAGQKYL